jgi:hypothetical protein
MSPWTSFGTTSRTFGCCTPVGVSRDRLNDVDIFVEHTLALYPLAHHAG